MAGLLLAVGSCSEAFALAPLARALLAAERPCRIAWFGEAAALADARRMGMPEPNVAEAPAAACPPAARFAAAAQFAASLLVTPTALVLTSGHDTFAQALGAAAAREGVPHLRLMAGVRSHRPGCAVDRQRRLADHAGSHFAVAGEWQRHELTREGLASDRIHTVGSLLAAALAATTPPPASRDGRSLVLAIEHAATLADAATTTTLLATLARAAGPHAVTAIAAPLAQAVANARLAVPANVTVAGAADANAQLAIVSGARVLVTDSAGHQELAAALDIPCVVLAGAGALPEWIASGSCTSAHDHGDDLAAAIARQLARGPRPPAPTGTTVATNAAVLAAIGAILAPAASAVAAAPAPALPSDGDASGRTLGEDEVALASAAIRRGTLNSTRGTFVTRFEQRFAQWLGRKHAIACASGSAAMHCAIAALQLQPGDEVVTTPITDMGALTPIAYEGGVPVFADVDPHTLNVTAATLAAQCTARTRALVVTHLFGLPCELGPIRALARERGLVLIEDTAQAFGATYAGRKVGTFGALAAFSLQQGKHITTGEGGIVATDDDALARRLFLYVNKAWGYGDPKPDHYFPALNYRLTELQGAVALAQLPKLDHVVAARRSVAASLAQQLAAVPGLRLPGDPQHGTHSFWKFAFQVDPVVIPGGALALGKRMQQAGIACVPRYIQKPAFECELFTDWRKSPVTWLPLQHNPRRDQAQPLFARRDYPGAITALEHVVVLPINERYTPTHVHTVATAIAAAAAELRRG